LPAPLTLEQIKRLNLLFLGDTVMTINTPVHGSEVAPLELAAAKPSLIRAGRATGAIFLAGFGGVWVALAAVAMASTTPWIPLMALGLLCGAVIAQAIRVRRRFGWATALIGPAASKRLARHFAWINGVQWSAIVLTVIALNSIGRPEWITPTIMLIVAAHFLPLARLFREPVYVVFGVGLILLSVAYPWLTVQGPQQPLGPLCFGLALLAMSIRNLLTPISASASPAA
jgi:hypothetical protein